MNLGVCIPVGRGRQENYRAVMASLAAQTVRPRLVVAVFDGTAVVEHETDLRVISLSLRKHEPGMEHPRNIGVRVLERHGCNWVWFLDSDVIVDEGAHGAYRSCASDADVLIGPYDWLPPGVRRPIHEARNDPRWPSFDGELHVRDLGAGLACFGGNICWRIPSFKSIGGFWNELSCHRVEDGELGLRACALGLPMRFVHRARGWHLHHEVNHQRVAEINAREVPMLNARHPWVAQGGVDLEAQPGTTKFPESGSAPKGMTFMTKCGLCGECVETRKWWWHACEEGT